MVIGGGGGRAGNRMNIVSKKQTRCCEMAGRDCRECHEVP